MTHPEFNIRVNVTLSTPQPDVASNAEISEK
jgi:hypothetical protein